MCFAAYVLILFCETIYIFTYLCLCSTGKWSTVFISGCLFFKLKNEIFSSTSHWTVRMCCFSLYFINNTKFCTFWKSLWRFWWWPVTKVTEHLLWAQESLHVGPVNTVSWPPSVWANLLSQALTSSCLLCRHESYTFKPMHVWMHASCTHTHGERHRWPLPKAFPNAWAHTCS